MGSLPPRPHAVAMPCPLHGHITPFFHLFKLLTSHGFTVTYITTPRFQPNAHEIQELQSQDLDIRIALVHDGLPPDYRVCVNDFPNYLRHLEMLREPVEDLVEKIRADLSRPPITCVLSDSHLGWLQDVANKFSLPRVCFLTSSTTEFSVLFHQPMLVAQGLLPFKGRCNGTSLEASGDVISCIPGVPLVQRTDFPSFLQVEDSADYEFQYFMRQIKRVGEAERLMVTSFEELEAPVIEALRRRINIRPIGPVILLGEGGVEASPGAEEEEEEWEGATTTEAAPAATEVASGAACVSRAIPVMQESASPAAATVATPRACVSPPAMKAMASGGGGGGRQATDEERVEAWLEQQEARTVVYVAFGTLANLEETEVRAIAGGLEALGQRFVWAMREGVVEGVAEALPAGFKERAEAEGRGLVVQWAPQRRLLSHPSVAAFLTHCGWGSTLEGVCAGVPLLCWPLYGDQLLNCQLLTDTWRAGVRISVADAHVDRRHALSAHDVAAALAVVTRSPEYRVNMRKLQAAARRASTPSGSSAENFRQFVSDMFSLARASA